MQPLFGGTLSWDNDEWIASDDRVRGGKSQSYLSCSPSTARFYGSLDIKTLGGAGFASQRTVNDDCSWDLAAYDGIEIAISDADTKQYTLILKDRLLPRDPDTGKEQSTISYEYDFRLDEDSSRSKTTIFIPWKDFTATYRGREKKDAPPIDTSQIKRFSLMNRSFFGSQEGDFSLTICSLIAITADERDDPLEERCCASDATDGFASEKGAGVRHPGGVSRQGWLSRLLSDCWKL